MTWHAGWTLSPPIPNRPTRHPALPGGLFHLLGDIVAILDSNGTTVVQYKYDAWGKPISKTGSMKDILGNLNPFRYRGYIYDEETGFYYLRSRYYYPNRCRFINTDSIFANIYHVGALNILSYCFNSPITHIDPSGCTVIPVPPSFAGEFLKRLVSELLKGAVLLLSLILAELGIEAIDEATSDSNSDATPTPSPSPNPTPNPSPLPPPRPNQTPEPNVYKGIRIFAGDFITLTGELTFAEAIAWAYSVGETQTIGKNASWGIWTAEQSDAYLLALTLGSFKEPVHDFEWASGHYAHYHVHDRLFMGKYKHFHIWYGTPNK